MRVRSARLQQRFDHDLFNPARMNERRTRAILEPALSVVAKLEGRVVGKMEG
jgi:hypothetical protein